MIIYNIILWNQIKQIWIIHSKAVAKIKGKAKPKAARPKAMQTSQLACWVFLTTWRSWSPRTTPSKTPRVAGRRHQVQDGAKKGRETIQPAWAAIPWSCYNRHRIKNSQSSCHAILQPAGPRCRELAKIPLKKQMIMQFNSTNEFNQRAKARSLESRLKDSWTPKSSTCTTALKIWKISSRLTRVHTSIGASLRLPSSSFHRLKAKYSKWTTDIKIKMRSFSIVAHLMRCTSRRITPCTGRSSFCQVLSLKIPAMTPCFNSWVEVLPQEQGQVPRSRGKCCRRLAEMKLFTVRRKPTQPCWIIRRIDSSNHHKKR